MADLDGADSNDEDAPELINAEDAEPDDKPTSKPGQTSKKKR